MSKKRNISESSSSSSNDQSISSEAKKQEEEERQERKLKAMQSITKLLNLSEKYSNLWQKRFESVELFPSCSKERYYAKDNLRNTSLKNMKYFNGKLRPYQEEGVKWLETLFVGGVNGILADEMGLGKTIQVICLLARLLENKIVGPHLIICPLSTLPNWESEFKRFSPQIPVVVFNGNEMVRNEIKSKISAKYNVDGLITSPVVLVHYLTATKEISYLSKFSWKYVVIDEAQRIKNHESILAREVRKLRTNNKLLLTGTPLQNNMIELWALLNFVMPQIFKNLDAFSSLFALEDMEDQNIINERKENNTIIATIHKVLAPFMLRRLKKDVLPDIVPKKELQIFCPMTEIQAKIYRATLQRNIDDLKGIEDVPVMDDIYAPKQKRKCSRNVNYKFFENINLSDDEEPHLEEKPLIEVKECLEENQKKYFHNVKLQFPMMMLRKVVDHPYLISTPYKDVGKFKEIIIDENLVTESGKLMVLDAMLHKLKKGGHKVLLFSTFTKMLDLIEEFMIMRKLTYRRLDGSYGLETRRIAIDEFNSDPNILAFLISTRAGGLGLNLVGADTVIFYDRDWNPQVDIQAQDRCHRIGQTKPVMVYTLLTKNTIDEHIVKSGEMKRRLEKLIIKDGKFKSTKGLKDIFTSEELEKMLKDIQSEAVIHPNGFVLSDKELDKMLDRSELLKQLKSQQKKLEEQNIEE